MANKKIRQEINLTNVIADPVDSVAEFYGDGGAAFTDIVDYRCRFIKLVT